MQHASHTGGSLAALSELGLLKEARIPWKPMLGFGLGGGAVSAALSDPDERYESLGKGLLAGGVGGLGFGLSQASMRKLLTRLLGPQAWKKSRAQAALAGATGFSGFKGKTLRDKLKAGLRTGHHKGLTEGLPALGGLGGVIGAEQLLYRADPELEDRPTLANAIEEKLGQKIAKEFAPGIPKNRPTSRIPTVKPASPLRWVMAVQDHDAKKARRHFDLRLVDPDAHKAHSWAIPKAKLPDPGEKLLAIQTFTHTPEYALHFGEKKPETIGKGYGAGRVRITFKAPTKIIEANNTFVRFNVHNGKDNQEYLLRRTRGDKWLLMNTTKDRTKSP